jgi:AbrB family looped-hinge helix DNA binding protein
MYAKISKKGQVTIPKAIREKLKIGADGGVLFLIEDGAVILQGVPGSRSVELGGSLKRYAPRFVPLQQVRKRIKGKVARDAAREGLSD